jgi:phosphohistidine swiveling domain-containing protein
MSHSSAQAQTGQPIPTVPDFSVTWDDPHDAKLTWMLNDKYKAPISPLIHAVVGAFLVSNSAGFERTGLPLSLRVVRLNTYQYIGIVPKAAPPEAVMKGMGLLNRTAPGVFKLMMGKMGAGMSKQQEAALNPIVERFEAYWLDELLPEIKQHIAYFESCDLRGMSLDQLRAQLAETIQRVKRLGALHGFALMPSLFAMSQFEELYCELFEGSSTLDALRLTQGFDNKILEGDRALWHLSRTARAIPEVSAILSERAASEVIPALEKSDASQPFLTDLRAWIAYYGQRLNSAFSLGEPSWIEDPTPAIKYLRAYLAQPVLRPEMEPATLAAEREQAVADARVKLTGYPQPIITHFEMLLKAAQTAAVVLKDHNFWIDQRLFYHVRRLILEFGLRLAQAGTLAVASDVFYLTPDELKSSGSVVMESLVQERKAEMERFSQVTPPPMLGTPPAFEMDGGAMMRAMFKGEASQPKTHPHEANRVQGLAGSAGVARGTARVIHSLAEAGKLQPGDVLIAEATVPPWTPLFAIACAVVTDAGGVLSHSAVVAREYRIPAVVGTGSATTTFHDGQLLEVDGDAGTVRVVVGEAEHESALVG